MARTGLAQIDSLLDGQTPVLTTSHPRRHTASMPTRDHPSCRSARLPLEPARARMDVGLSRGFRKAKCDAGVVTIMR